MIDRNIGCVIYKLYWELGNIQVISTTLSFVDGVNFTIRSAECKLGLQATVATHVDFIVAAANFEYFIAPVQPFP